MALCLVCTRPHWDVLLNVVGSVAVGVTLVVASSTHKDAPCAFPLARWGLLVGSFELVAAALAYVSTTACAVHVLTLLERLCVAVLRLALVAWGTALAFSDDRWNKYLAHDLPGLHCDDALYHPVAAGVVCVWLLAVIHVWRVLRAGACAGCVDCTDANARVPM